MDKHSSLRVHGDVCWLDEEPLGAGSSDNTGVDATFDAPLRARTACNTASEGSHVRKDGAAARSKLLIAPSAGIRACNTLRAASEGSNARKAMGHYLTQGTGRPAYQLAAATWSWYVFGIRVAAPWELELNILGV